MKERVREEGAIIFLTRKSVKGFFFLFFGQVFQYSLVYLTNKKPKRKNNIDF